MHSNLIIHINLLFLNTKSPSIPQWIIRFLKFAGYYNLAWGVYIMSRPLDFYNALNPEVVSAPLFLYPFGAAVLLFGVFYLIAAAQAVRFQVFIFLGLGSKLLGPLVAYFLLLEQGYDVLNFYLHIIFNDLLWVLPMAWGFYLVFKVSQNTEAESKAQFPSVLSDYQNQEGSTLSDLSQEKPLLIVFLRHFGCTFCKEALGDISQKQEALAEEGVKIVLVHMGSESDAQAYFAKYGIAHIDRVSDPSCILYRVFGLQRASFLQVFGLKSFTRGFYAGILKGHGIGKLVGDGFRMPGVFLVHQNKILQSYKHQTASDVPDYQAIASCELK